MNGVRAMAKNKKPQNVMARALAVFQKHWGHDDFREAQAQVIESVMKGKDVLAVLPTGYGKSAAFQVPAMLWPGTALVVSPLISLMKDQCDDCMLRDIPATYVNSHVTDADQEKRFANLLMGRYKVFYIAPERINNRKFRATIRAALVNLLVVDEAHCVSRWGHDFRPAYSRIKDILPLLSHRPPIVAVTATATFDIEADVALRLDLDENYVRVVGDPVRPNLQYAVVWGNPWKMLSDEMREWDILNGRYIAYCGTRKGSENVWRTVAATVGADIDTTLAKKHFQDWQDRLDALAKIGGRFVGLYHAGMTKQHRTEMQEKFKTGECPIMIATCAFGMGIDVPNIRSVVHFGIPGSLEDYCQEAGRAGRDGLHSRVVILVEEDDYSFMLQKRFVENANPPYIAYVHVWAWLNEVLGPGDVLSMSGALIAEKVVKMMGVPIKGGGYAALSVLNTMEAYGLVRRRPALPGTMLDVNVSALEALNEDGAPGLSPTVSDTVSVLWESVVVPITVGCSLERLNAVIDRRTLAEQIGKSEATLVKALKTIEETGVLNIEPRYKGKTTQLLKPGVDIVDAIPQAVIETKRARELLRLHTMISYTRVLDRPQILRDYFLKGIGQ